MMTCFEINRLVKKGLPVMASLPNVEGALPVLKARVCFLNQLQVRVRVAGVEQWRTTDYSAVRVSELLETEQ